MKNRFLLCVVVICGLLASPLLNITQAQATRKADQDKAPTVAQDDADAKQLENDQEDVAKKIAMKCPKPPIVVMAGTADNFVDMEPVTLSPALNSFFGANPHRNFDEGGPNKMFGHSFKMNSCKVCAASLQVRVKNEQPLNNASLIVGVAPFTPGARKFVSVTLPPTTLYTTSVLLPTPALNNYIANYAGSSWLLDLYIKDDRTVDFAKLTVWYY